MNNLATQLQIIDEDENYVTAEIRRLQVALKEKKKKEEKEYVHRIELEQRIVDTKATLQTQVDHITYLEEKLQTTVETNDKRGRRSERKSRKRSNTLSSPPQV